MGLWPTTMLLQGLEKKPFTLSLEIHKLKQIA